MNRRILLLFSLSLSLLTLSTLTAQAVTIFSDGLDSLANWLPAQQADTTADIVDYSALGIPEAPNMVAATGATTGVKFTANNGDATAAAAAINLIGSVSGGNADLSLSRYQVSFDMWLNVGNPIPSGGTEQGVFGIGRTTTAAIGRNNRTTSGDGTFGWLATENGYGTEDTVVFANTVEQARKSGGSNTALFNSAFQTTISSDVADAPANQWVAVTVTANNGAVRVFYNNREFFSVAGPTSGDVMIGYEDPFGSISADGVNQFGIFDNVVISDNISVPEPASFALLGVSLVGLLAMGRKRA